MHVELRAARPEDATGLLAFMREFNALQTYSFDEPGIRRALAELLSAPELGRIWLIAEAGAAVGYVVLTFGYSLEHGGRDALIDELFVASHARGRGLGRAAVVLALEQAATLGVNAVHLEVERTNPSAHALYRSLGFAGNDRQLLTRKLRGGPTVDVPPRADDPT